MSEQVTETPTDSQAQVWLSGAGLAVVAIGLIGAVILWSDMSDSDRYATADIWVAVLTALGVATLGLIVLALGLVVGRLDRD